MGIRIKLLLTFILCFGLMAGISLPVLERSMDESYAAIEKRDLTAHMGRVVQSVEAGLISLSTQVGDWAVWTEMYNFAAKPDAAWAKDNIGALAMKPANLSLAMVYGAQGQLLSMNTRDHEGKELLLPGLQASPYAGLFKTPARGPRCGLIKSDAGLMLSCWANITRSDGSGDFVGTVVMGRLLDQSLIAKLREQTRLPLALHDVRDLPGGLSVWPGVLPAASIGKPEFWSRYEPNQYHLYYVLQDLLQRDVGVFTLDVSRDVHEQGARLFRQVRRQFVWTALGTAVLLGIAVHFLLIRRLRKFTAQLVKLARESTWNTRISIKGGDELGILSSRVNTLLSLIESQVDSLKALTLTDALTGLANRRNFDARLALEFSRQQRTERPLALLLLDVDHFKRYNDHYGHPAGDLALKELAQVLRVSVARASDLPARIGGEEFAILLPETDAVGANALAAQVRQNLQKRCIPHADSPVAPHMTVSIGIAITIAKVRSESMDAFVSRADNALYQAKHEGRDRACNAAPPPVGNV